MNKSLIQKDTTSEKILEKKLTNALHGMGIWCQKYTNPYRAGYPDRLCIAPNGLVFWVEVKSRGAKPRPLQEERMHELRAHGMRTFVVDSAEGIKNVLDFATRISSMRVVTE